VLSSDGRELFFSSDRPGGPGGKDLWVSTRSSAGAFSTPRLVAPVNSAGDETYAWPSPDGRRLYLTSDRSGATLLYVASRADRGSPFGAPAPLRGIDLSSESHPTFSPDELEIIYAAPRPGTLTEFDLWRARRPDVASPFGAPANLTAVSTPDDDHDPSLSADGTILYFVRYLYPRTDADIWMATRPCTP
jgi:Tol biopolymer transport system component